MRFDAVIENEAGASRIVLVCEHASNVFPEEFGTLELETGVQSAHVAWDPGALALAQALSTELDAALVHAPVSRLIHDLNRPPHAEAAMPHKSEVYDIPGNRALSARARVVRAAAVYLPFHQALQRLIVERLAQHKAPVLVTIHSFTPVYFGQPRALEFGVIHDGDGRFAQHVLAGVDGLTAALNEPYSAADGVTHLIRLHALPYDLPHAMLEIRNDLIADSAAQAAMAARLAPALRAALEGV